MSLSVNLLTLAVLGLYLTLTGYFLHSRWLQATAITPQRRAIEHLGLGLALLASLPLPMLPLLAPLPHFGSREALLLLAWLTLALYWTASFFYDLEGMQPILLPFASVAALVSLALPPGHAIAIHPGPLLTGHFVLAMLAYSLFAIATGLAILHRLADRQLHRHLRLDAWQRLPPLLSLERLMFHALSAGFLLLTLTLSTGIGFSELTFGRPATFNHKTILSLLAWCTYGVLLLGHYWRGWRGRSIANWAIAGFVLLLLAYIGTRFVLEVLLASH